MNILFIKLSPRPNGTSTLLINMFRNVFEEHGNRTTTFDLSNQLQCMDDIVQEIDKSDTIMFIGSTYFNCYPSDILLLFHALAKKQEVIHHQKVYGLIQGGMPYVHTHISGVKILHFFCEQEGFDYMGHFVIGNGPMINGKSLNTHPKAFKLKKCLKQYMQIVEHQENVEDIYKDAEVVIKKPFLRLIASFNNYAIRRDLLKSKVKINDSSPYFDKLRSGKKNEILTSNKL